MAIESRQKIDLKMNGNPDNRTEKRFLAGTPSQRALGAVVESGKVAIRIQWLSRVLRCAAKVMFILPLGASASLVADGDLTGAPNPGSFRTYGYNNGTDDGGARAGSILPAGATMGETLSLAAGMYKVTFAESGNPYGPPGVKRFSVSLGSGPLQILDYTIGANTHASVQWATQTADFKVSGGPTALTFGDAPNGAGINNPVGLLGATPWGAVIGNVSLTAVPEPAAITSAALLMLLPLGASAARVLRRK
jgi:hypothetical protein